jgi:deoxyribodipyrimidine photo-lyase
MAMVATREEGLNRLDIFLNISSSNYTQFRNYDYGPNNHKSVSLLSPYLRHRLITEREVVSSVLAKHSLRDSEKYIQEVFWRSYFKGWMEHRPYVWEKYKSELNNQLGLISKNKFLNKAYEQALAGQTGIKCFDFWVNELKETGYLHNHARMWFASIWIFTLKLPWELGADFFLCNLIDGDAASNTLSWRWVAGLHTKGKSYLARADNIERFTCGRFNPKGQLEDSADPLSEPEYDIIDNVLPASDLHQADKYLLLVHEDGCQTEQCFPENLNITGAVGLQSTALRSVNTINKNISEFARGALESSLMKFGPDNKIIEKDWASELLSICNKQGVRNILMHYAPTGPTADAIKKAMPLLLENQIEISYILREWDKEIWPFANKGFFKVKKKIPKILESLNIRLS